jgi:hypothetical protein
MLWKIGAVVSLTLLTPLGCKKSVGELQTLDVIGDAPGDPSHPATVRVEMSKGELHMTPGGGHVVGGAVKTNVAALGPVVAPAGDRVTVSQGKAGQEAGDYGSEFVGDWRLTLGTTPMVLQLSTGAAKTDLELGGLAIKSLAVRGSAGDVHLGFSSPNLLAAEQLDVECSAGAITLTDVARFGAKEVRVHSAAGAVSVSLGPKVEREMTLDLEATAGSVKLVVPAGVSTRTEVKTAAGVVKATGWTKDGEAFILGPATPTPRVTVRARTAAGNITLETSS